MICKVCNQEFTGRSDARFCSAKCRVTANRNKADGIAVTDVTDNVTDNVTDKYPPYKPAHLLKDGEFNRVSKPGDPDYHPSSAVEYCRACGDILPQLEQPRKHPAKCLACVTGKQATISA